jgi:4-amino-4-deoxy-L-arabinose transferase-like glycosyltransferase
LDHRRPHTEAVTPQSTQVAPGERTALRLRAFVFALAAVVPLVVGQVGRDLLPPDDLREAEVAREMWAGGDYVVPRLAGLPFVEKPPGFQAVVASAFALAGGPTTAVARAVAAGFSLLSLVAVFALGLSALGVEGAGLAVALLGLASRFCRTAHTVLLDNALTASFAFALLFFWRGLGAKDARAKQRAYTAVGFALGLAFLFKGFVGPALFAAGTLAYLGAARRMGELRSLLRPLPILAFLLPVLAWVAPFVARASPGLVRTFFIDNHWGRAAGGYASNVRPFYFYALDLWQAFLPAAVPLPFAAFWAFRRRRAPGGEVGLFLLSFAAGPLLLLSLSRAKDSVYALPAFPALALLVAAWCEDELRRGTRWAVRTAKGAGFGAAVAAGVAILATVYLGGVSWGVCGAVLVLAALATSGLWLGRRGDLRGALAAGVGMAALGWSLWFTGPLAENEVDRRSIRGPVEAALSIAGDRTVLLFNPSDGLRGAASFWRNRTAEEVQDPTRFVQRLLDDPNSVALFHLTARTRFLEFVRNSFSQLGAQPVVEASVPAGENRLVLLWAARRLIPEPRGDLSSVSP